MENFDINYNISINDVLCNNFTKISSNVKTEIKKYQVNKYEIEVMLGPNNEFLGIKQIKINKKFSDFSGIKDSVFRNIEKFYED